MFLLLRNFFFIEINPIFIKNKYYKMKNKPAGDTSLHQDQGPIAHKQTNYNQTKQTPKP